MVALVSSFAASQVGRQPWMKVTDQTWYDESIDDSIVSRSDSWMARGIEAEVAAYWKERLLAR